MRIICLQKANLYTIEDTHRIESTLNALPTNHWGNALESSSFMLCLAQNHKKMQDMEARKDGKTRWITRKVQDKSYTRPESYTLSFTGKPQCIKGFSRIGVGNVGEKHKTFFWRVGSGNAKHRTSLRQTSVLSRQNIGTLPQKSPMFLISGRAAPSPKKRRHKEPISETSNPQLRA